MAYKRKTKSKIKKPISKKMVRAYKKATASMRRRAK